MSGEEGVSVVPSEDDPRWFCERGNFWGTAKQLCLCARCGKNEFKMHNQPRHYSGICTPQMHTVCDSCFDALPDEPTPDV